MVLTGLYCLIVSIAPVTLGQYTLNIDVIFVEGLFDDIKALVINDVDIGFIDVLLEALMACIPGVCDGFGLMVLDGNRVY